MHESQEIQTSCAAPAADSREPVRATELPVSIRPSGYPPRFAALIAGREKRRLGEWFGLGGLGVNLTRLAPGAQSALHHRHSRDDEFLFVLKGEATLITDAGEWTLGPGACMGFPAGGLAHHLVNRSEADVVYLEAGTRAAGDEVTYPRDDLAVSTDAAGRRVAVHKDGTPW